MKFKDPVAAYNAATNIEAHLVCDILVDAGVEALAVDDVSPIGVWVGGLVPEIHKPQVWIERADVERAALIIQDYEQRNSKRRNADRAKPSEEETIEVACEECGKASTFPRSQIGSVQTCPHCWKFMDVDSSTDSNFAGEWSEFADESSDEIDRNEEQET